jgi:hypothetical protein
MKKVLAYALLIICPLLPSAAVGGEIYHPLGVDCFDFDYDMLYRAGVLAGDLSSLDPIGPYLSDDVNRLSGPASSTSMKMFDLGSPDQSGTLPENSLRLFSISSERMRSIRGRRSDDLPSIIGGFVHQPGRYFGAIMFFNLDRARAVDPLYTGKKYRGLAGDVTTAALFFRKDRFSVTMGRSRVFWGPQRTNLLISETAEPFDRISASYKTGRLSLNFIFARLDGPHPDALDSLRFPDRTFNDNRYLVGHRLDIKLHRRFQIGFFETVLYGGEGRPPELYYLNPLQFFHGAQLNENQDDNTILGLDFTFLPGGGAGLYGQLIVDDFQIDNYSQGDQEPNELGFMLGLFKAGRIASLVPDLKLEYVRLTNRTYHQRDPDNRYLYRNRLIGHPLGPDADSLALSIRFRPQGTFMAELELAYRRKGEGSVYQPWDEPWILAAGDYSEPFPTGIIEKSGLIALRLQGYLPLSRYTRDHFFISAVAGWGEIHNYLNVAGDVETVARLDLRLSWLGFADLGLD